MWFWLLGYLIAWTITLACIGLGARVVKESEGRGEGHGRQLGGFVLFMGVFQLTWLLMFPSKSWLLNKSYQRTMQWPVQWLLIVFQFVFFAVIIVNAIAAVRGYNDFLDEPMKNGLIALSVLSVLLSFLVLYGIHFAYHWTYVGSGEDRARQFADDYLTELNARLGLPPGAMP